MKNKANPLFATASRILANRQLDGFAMNAIEQFSNFDREIKRTAFRIHQLTSEAKNLDEIPGLYEGMRKMGCSDPEQYVESIKAEFAREFVAPSSEREY